jgi:hypothetical protein
VLSKEAPGFFEVAAHRQVKAGRALVRVLVFWQTALRLTDWRITIRAADKKEMDGRKAFVDLYPNSKEADVALRRVHRLDHDLESDLVHELLHVVYWQPSLVLGRKEEDDTVPFEQGLNVVAELLVRMRRGANLVDGVRRSA